MTAPRLSEVAARVVAWHNRHPLARRIDASQVHSIGEVRLPFASAQAWGHAAPASPADATAATVAVAPPADHVQAPSLADALAQRHARHAPAQPSGIDGLDVASVLPEPEPAPDAAAADEPQPEADAAAVVPAQGEADDDDDGEAALVIPLLDGDEAQATPEAAADTSAEAPSAAAQAAADADAPESPADLDLDFGAPAPSTAPPTDPTSAAGDSPAPSEHSPDAATDTAVAAAAEVPAESVDVYPPPHGNVPASALARAVERRAAARGAAPPDADIRAAAPAGMGVAADGPPAPAATSRWRRLVDAVRALITGRQRSVPPLRATFSSDFAWPLRPGAVARWAQRHGRPEPLAPLDWPRRSVDSDRAQLARHRGKGFAHDLPLHVLTAAIGVGDRRIRVLIGADGSILGSRAFDRSRSGAAAMLAAVGLVALGWTLRPLQAPPAEPAALLAAAPAAAASAPAAPASAASAPAEAASVATVAEAAASAASAAHAEHAGAHAANAASAPDAAASEPPGDIRPMLTDEAKYTAKVEAAALRGEPPPAPPEPAGPVYAVISPGSASPEIANRSLALMRAAADRLDGGAPAHGELINSQGQWRAAWWPFASLVDAERARVLLAGRGVKAEVVEF